MTILSRSLTTALALGLVLTPLFTLAAPVASTTRAAKLDATATNAKTRADQEIDRRIASLTKLSTRVGEMTKLSPSQISGLQSDLAAQIKTLTDLKAKIDADTDLATLRADIHSITESYRIYALVLPRTHIVSAADRILTVVADITALEPKLEARIAAATTSDKSALDAAYADMKAKIADAQTQATAAVSLVIGLAPDNGDKSVGAGNAAALKEARTKIEAATKDLKAARADIKTILGKLAGGLKIGGAKASTASTTQP
jgi:hypothetical protein